MAANDRQVGGTHYKKGGEEHWDRVYRLFGPGYFIGNITKYAERYQEKEGKKDLEKIIHYAQKLIELEYPDRPKTQIEQIAEDIKNGTFKGVPPEWERTAYSEEGTPMAAFNPEHEPLKSFPTGHPPPPGPLVKQWEGFTFEGGDKDQDLYKCHKCRQEIWVAINQPPICLNCAADA